MKKEIIKKLKAMTLNKRWEYYLNNILDEIRIPLDHPTIKTRDEAIKASNIKASKLWRVKPDEIDLSKNGHSIPLNIYNALFRGKLINSYDQEPFWTGTKIRDEIISHNNQESLVKASSKYLMVVFKSPEISTFCSLIDKSGISKIGIKSVKDFCTEICNKYDLPYTDRVRQNFNSNLIDKNLKIIEDRILPHINQTDRDQIVTFLKNGSEIFG